MKYIANKLEDNNYEIIGLSLMKTINGEEVEVINGTKVNNLEKMEEALEEYKKEKEMVIKQYDNDITEMEKMIEAMKNVK